MFLLDSLLVGGLRFVLDKVATVVDTEMNDDSALHEQLLAARCRLELGEISRGGVRQPRGRRARAAARHSAPQPRQSPAVDASDDYKVTGVEASIEGDEH